jgi:N-acetylneuraminic acid mutarotase
MPGARVGAVTWIDASGNLWLFGGNGSNPLGYEFLNDLWKYNVATGEWTWMSGANTVNANGMYGSLGKTAATNVPGARQAAVGWTDSSGNLWLFGGQGYDATSAGYGTLGDLWEYTPSSGEWTWQGGTDTEATPTITQGVYGTKGQPAATNLPGPRASAVAWTDGSGNFWLFGGMGYDSIAIFGDLNDLWKYSPSTGQWTWMSGCDLSGCSAVYGNVGQQSPGARDSAVASTDTSGNFWLFGGSGVDVHGIPGILNDLWKYSPATDQWTWVSGSQVFVSMTGVAGVYGTRGQPAASNVPGSRYSPVAWTDAGGNFWLLGGNGYDSTATALNPSRGWLNDLWKYNPSTSQWTWEGRLQHCERVGRVRPARTTRSDQRTWRAI